MNALSEQLQQHFSIPAEQVQQVSSLFQPEKLAKGAAFVTKGGVCRRLSFVTAGYIRVFDHTAEKEVTQWISGPGYFITDLASMLFNQPARWHMEAITDVEMFTLSRSDYQHIHQYIPNWDKLEKLFIARCFGTIEDRVFSFLALTAAQRYEMLLHHQPQLLNHVPHHYVASMLGMTPETLSRIRRAAIS